MSKTGIPEQNTDSQSKEHYVTFTATFAVAFQRTQSDHTDLEQLLKRDPHAKNTNKTLSLEAPKPRHYFHSEMQILQDKSATGSAPRYDTDIVTYGVACKMFREGETKLIRTYDDPLDDKTWFVYWLGCIKSVFL